MSATAMRFCKRGHEFNLVGKTRWGNCYQCYKTRNPNGSSLRNGFCFRGHDTKITGRNKSKECNLCRTETNRKHAWKGYLNDSREQFSTLDYNRLYQLQGGKCAMCSRHQSEIKKTLEVDHDHKTMFVRGLLCTQCNMDLGKYESYRIRAEKYINRNFSHKNLTETLVLDSTDTEN